jgi:hypothetical protein
MQSFENYQKQFWFQSNMDRLGCNVMAQYIPYTVIIFLAGNGMGEIFPNQQILRLNNGRNSPKSEEIRPKFWGRTSTARIRPVRPKKYLLCTVVKFSVENVDMASKGHWIVCFTLKKWFYQTKIAMNFFV